MTKKAGVRERMALPDARVRFWETHFPEITEPNALRLLWALRAVAIGVNDSASAWVESVGLTAAQYTYLAVLYSADGTITSNDLGSRVHTTSASVALMVAALERAGFVTRTENPQDKRSTLVRLTRRGVRVVETAYPMHQRFAREILAGVPVEDRKELIRILGQIAEGLDRWSP